MFKLFKKKKIEGFYYIEGENTGLPMSWHLLTSRDALKTYNFSSEENAEQYAKIYFPNFVKTQSLHFLKHPLDFINETANGTKPVLAVVLLLAMQQKVESKCIQIQIGLQRNITL